MIKIYENSMNSSQWFKAGLHKPQHTSLGTSFNENGRVYVFIYISMPAGCSEACSHTYGANTEPGSPARVTRDQLEGFWV